MTVISFPRRADTVRPDRRATRRVTRAPARRPVHVATAPRRRAISSTWRGSSAWRKSAMIVVVALVLSLAGSMVVANRQIQLHALQSQLLQDQSTYAQQVGALTLMAAPSQIATQAGALHLGFPVSETQVPSTPLDKPLPLPKFIGSAPATSRTIR